MTQTHRILKSYPISAAPAIAPGEITLREWGQGQWVTHFHNMQDDGYYYGHYFANIADAEADFERRVKQELRLPPDAELPPPTLAPVKVPDRVYEGLVAVREACTVNLFKINVVQAQAAALGYKETADWIKANPDLYIDGVCRGFELM